MVKQSQEQPASGKYLTFEVGGQQFGIPVLNVREIIGMQPITAVPGSPVTMIGVINLRGNVIPVLSMRTRFTMPAAEAHPHNVIIVVEGASRDAIGLAVDRVREVTLFAPGDTEPPPSYGLDIEGSLVAALGKSQGQIRILLDIDRVLAVDGEAGLDLAQAQPIEQIVPTEPIEPLLAGVRQGVDPIDISSASAPTA